MESIKPGAMSSILDIDLDYFTLMKDPVKSLEDLLAWAKCPVSFVVDKHHKALGRWIKLVSNRTMGEPEHVLHVDEHHDMMDEGQPLNIANFLFHAMRRWPKVRVHWLVDEPLDDPSVWLSEEAWKTVSDRFTWGPKRPKKWPKPQIVSVCTSPEFVSLKLRRELLAIIKRVDVLDI